LLRYSPGAGVARAPSRAASDTIEKAKARSRAVGRKLKDVEELPAGQVAAWLPPNVPEDDVEVGEGDNVGVDSQ
jgi:hypothetical protein